MRKSFIPAAMVAIALPVAAFAAQGGAGAGAVGGAITGGVVGGPVGAAVGGVIGAIVGGTIAPPPAQVVSYVTTQPAPSAVTLQGNLVVGATLPESVTLLSVPATVYSPAPDGVGYAYAFVNGKKVVVDAKTRAVVAIVG